MEKAAAIQIAGAARGAKAVATTQEVVWAEPRIIEIETDPSDGARKVRDVRVWIVRFEAGMAWTELAVDDGTGAVVRVERSRAR